MNTAPSHPTTRQQLTRWLGWLYLATLATAVVVAQRYLAVIEPAGVPGSMLFRWVMLIGHMGTLLLVVLTPATLLAWIWPRAGLVIGLAGLSTIAFVLALLVDTQIYQLYRMHLDLGVMNLLTGGAATATFIFPGAMYAQAIAIAACVSVAMALVGAGLWQLVRRLRPRPALAYTMMAVLTLCVLGFHGTHVWADAKGIDGLIVETDVLPLRHAATAKRLMRRLGFELPPSAISANAVDRSSMLAYPLRPLTCERPARAPNIVLIVIDSWRSDAFNERVTPSIARFAHEASIFNEHYSGGNATRIGVFSLFYSVPGTYWHRILSERQGPVVVRELLDQHYDLQVFRSTPLYSPEFDRTVFVELPNVRLRSDGDGPADWDRDLTEDFKTFLRSRDPDRPFFSFLFYDSPHSFQYPAGYPLPFQPSLENVNYLELNAQTDPQPFVNRYWNSVHYDDSLVGEALQAIRDAGLMDDTIILITGDHGQEFNDTGTNFWGHNGNFSRYQTAVPFIWYEPGRPPRMYRHRTSHFDVMPTLLQEALDCEVPFDKISVGHPLFDPAPRDVMVMSGYNDFAIVEPDRISWVKRSGITVSDSFGRRVPGARPAPEALAEALELNRRFYRTPEMSAALDGAAGTARHPRANAEPALKSASQSATGK